MNDQKPSQGKKTPFKRSYSRFNRNNEDEPEKKIKKGKEKKKNVKEKIEAVRKLSRLMGMSKIVLAKETPEETGSIAKGGALLKGEQKLKEVKM